MASTDDSDSSGSGSTPDLAAIPKEGYMCKTDYLFHLENCLDGVQIYPSVKMLRKHKKCHYECGIVKVKISLDKVI